jgi:hypothetical protein
MGISKEFEHLFWRSVLLKAALTVKYPTNQKQPLML